MEGQDAIVSGTLASLVVAGSVVVAGPLYVTGNLNIAGVDASLDVGARTVTVGGELRTQSGGTLTMRDPAGVVDVEGRVYFDGGSTDGLLTAGELRVAGDFTAYYGGNTPTVFRATGTHRTVLDGAAAQNLYTYFNGATQSHFNDLEILNTSGVATSTHLRAGGDVDLYGVWSVAHTVTIEGLLTLNTGSTLDNGGTVNAATCLNLNATIIGTIPLGC